MEIDRGLAKAHRLIPSQLNLATKSEHAKAAITL
jgi:hypothetical protein